MFLCHNLALLPRITQFAAVTIIFRVKDSLKGSFIIQSAEIICLRFKWENAMSAYKVNFGHHLIISRA